MDADVIVVGAGSRFGCCNFISSSKSEQCHHCALDLNELLGGQSANPGMDIRPSDHRELVDHHTASRQLR
jgi:hypothetical protein